MPRYALAVFGTLILLQPPAVRADDPTVDSITVHFVVKDEDKETEGSFDVEVEKGGKRIVKKEGWGGGQLSKDSNTDDLDHEFTASVDGTIPLKGRYVLKSKLKCKIVDVCVGCISSRWSFRRAECIRVRPRSTSSTTPTTPSST